MAKLARKDPQSSIQTFPLAIVCLGLFGPLELLEVVPLYGLVQRELGQRVVDGEPLSLAAHEPRVLPLRQLLGHGHHVYFCPVLVLSVLELNEFKVNTQNT
ncbi:unnamed protein product [Colias eurytheme]|nr:unnamed protein product [Colias eurytheme]